ncbi:hypothetical protein C7330_0750 [Pectobacterium versatile]|nr:hypothetical protein C7330_0750 [Pectobacterium versatile]
MRWRRSVTRITYLSKLIGMPSLAAFLQLELFRVYFLSSHFYFWLFNFSFPLRSHFPLC